MKSIVVALFIINLFSPGLSLAQTTSLEVNVNNIKSQKGSIRVGLFLNEKDFLKNPAEGKVVKISGSEVTVVFENLKPGDYALSVIHDENENGELDSNAFGIPKEGFAFGNNSMGAFGPPTFEKAKVELRDQPIKQVIKLKYM
ncbi:MAG: hypothetical protein C0490_13530 [Marivirga sp.]|nr:hypothetical protein [Marivirga sp.]